MLNFYECHFEYNGINSREYGLIIAKLNTSDFTPIVGRKKGAFLFNRKAKANELMGDDYSDSPLSIEIELIRCGDEPFDLKTLHEVERWLFADSIYRRMYIDMDDDKYGETYELIDGVQKHLYFNCRFLYPEKILGNGGVIGFKCTLETDSLMLWQDEIKHMMLFNPSATKTVGGETRTILLGDVDMDGYVTLYDAMLALEVYAQVLIYPSWEDKDRWASVTTPPLTDDQLCACDMKYTSEMYENGDPPNIESEDPQIILQMYTDDITYIPQDKTVIIIEDGVPHEVIVPGVKVPVINVDSDIDGYTYPVVTFYMGAVGGDLSIKNISDDPSRETEFKRLPPGQKVVVDSRINSVSLYDNDGSVEGLYSFMTKKNFPRLVNGENKLEISGDIINIEYSWQNRRFL